MAAAHATTTSYKCRRCRQMLCLSSCIVDSHGELAKEVSSCALDTSNPDPLAGLLFLDSDKLPEWLTAQIDEGEWSKGRIHCPKCRARIGLFDFITGSKCGCLQYVLPGIQINKSKVDHHVPRPLQSSVVTPTRSYTCTEAKESGADVGVGMLTNLVSQPECVSIENTASHVAGLETEPVLHSSVAASESAGSLSQRNLSSVTCYQTSPHADTESISPRVTMDENTILMQL
ncbi:PREDICTED: E3 ubiquitin-protein ligase RNF180-like [Priapulus caudatus]|uniref:E3 ubiquitin-protein ligase RNF180-like n=1 Tax=Priapulus caudatus TaxID=37621 RepID=A0ABM1DWI4_PRICU|nr:PREDICTED: E3 ubiquitin-protein ligase RNF180-like [Priapulus caudatus]XP_014664304.1 PREDICTED: E3 ubiquitin-protein ligase RNF180-like [Priapulus caudatus]XP_014664305.1 PREDICTED: E3 ubiquitin-protein ligase RNF180-like [Priapulus caudatus]